jgi:tetratricopeptide (TPR) repeat protein
MCEICIFLKDKYTMTLQQISKLIGESWKLHRQQDHRTSANNFRQVLKEIGALEDGEDKSHHLVDAYYGLGLAERANGNKTEAIATFQQAHEHSQKILSMFSSKQDGYNNLATEEDDRFMMLTTMIGQRLSELGAKA